MSKYKTEVMKQPNIIVVGAGVIGLCTAVRIQEAVPNAVVTIVADKLMDDTVSFVAGGMFRPHTLNANPSEVCRRWIEDSFKEYSRLVHSAEGREAGATQLSQYIFDNKPYTEAGLDVIYGSREITETEKSAFPVKWKHGIFLTTLLIEPRYYMPYLLKRFKSKGGTVEQRKIHSFEEFVGKYDLVVNCTGLGARILANDNKVFPVRGQVFRVRAPWIKHTIYGSFKDKFDAYLIPLRDTVVVGGCRQMNNWNTSINKQDSEDIWKRCTTMVPSLKHAEIVGEYVGLRPYRDTIRVEAETMKFPAGSVKVVHNYGHDGAGICFAWGTAGTAAELAAVSLRGVKPKL